MTGMRAILKINLVERKIRSFYVWTRGHISSLVLTTNKAWYSDRRSRQKSTGRKERKGSDMTVYTRLNDINITKHYSVAFNVLKMIDSTSVY